MPTTRPAESRIAFQNSSTTPLGAIKLAGLIKQSRGQDQGQRRRLGSYALVYSLNGGCSYWDECVGKRQITAGDLMILFPNIAHRYGAGPRGHWDEFFIVFDGPIFDLWRDGGFLDAKNPILHLEPVPYWRRRIEACLETRGAIGRAAALRQICNLQALLAEILGRSGGGATSPSPPPWLEQACDALGSAPMRPLHLPALARSLGVSYETFRKTFAHMMGMPPSRYHCARVIDRACGMMESRLSGKEIADRLGFSDEYHFSKRFKQVTGLSPTEFRRQMRLS